MSNSISGIPRGFHRLNEVFTKSALTPKPTNNESGSEFYMDMSLLVRVVRKGETFGKRVKFYEIKNLSWNLNFFLIFFESREILVAKMSFHV